MIRLRNKSSLQQAIVYRGKRIVINAFEEQGFDDTIANIFLFNYPENICVADDDYGSDATKDEETDVWVANMTGNPDDPDKVFYKTYKDKRWQEIEQPNPHKAPKELKYHHGGGQQEYQTKAGHIVAYNLQGKDYIIPPYKRIKVSKAIGDWLMRRAGISELKVSSGYQPRSIIQSRAPTAFEPNMTWDYGKIVAYLTLIDPSAKVPESEAYMRKKAEKEKMAQEEIQFKIDEAKRFLLRRLYFRVVDPKFRLPTEQDITDIMEGFKPKAQEKTEMQAIIEKAKQENKDVELEQ